MANRAFIELMDAIEHLGGELPPEEQARATTLNALYPKRNLEPADLLQQMLSVQATSTER